MLGNVSVEFWEFIKKSNKLLYNQKGKGGNAVSDLKKTPLFDVYKEFGAKTIDFGGWDLPVQFSSIKEEHEAVRTKAGLFDVSHMGEIEVKGKESISFLQKMMANDLTKLKPGGTQYTPMCYENGGVVDDLLVYQRAENHYLLVVNAANTKKDLEWLKENLSEDAEIEDLSEKIALLALQGPLAGKILQKLVDDFDELGRIKYFKFAENMKVAGKSTLISRTGYTGEDGFEIYCDAQDAVELWRSILDAGREDGVLPCGLGARDTLRFEAGLPLYGQELSSEITPLEAGLGFAVKLDKQADFIGKDALIQQKEQGLKRKIVGIEMIDKGIPRHGYRIFKGDQQIGVVTTGTQSPTLKKNIGLALLNLEYTTLDTEVEVEIRGKRLKAKVIATPFYRR